MKIMETLNYFAIFLIMGFILFIFIFLPIMFLFSVGTPNNGSHTGYVTSVETSGLIFRTNGVYFKTDTQSSQEDKYCATNEVLDQLKKAQVEKKLITINYKRGFLMPIWECPGGSETEIISIQ